MLRYEIGFSVVIEKMAQVGKPVVGHNMMMDLCFLYQQFYKPMPKTYPEFALSFISEFLPTIYDTKVLSLYAQTGDCRWGKSDLQHLYNKCTNDKKYSNSLIFEPDCTLP